MEFRVRSYDRSFTYLVRHIAPTSSTQSAVLLHDVATKNGVMISFIYWSSLFLSNQKA